MAKEALQFGEKSNADVRLHIISSTGKEDEGSIVFSHSQVLKKAEFFETKLSERWSSDKGPFEIQVISCHSGEDYIKLIHLMYSYYTDEVFYFSGVDEALAILPVASEVLFRECVKECMVYLDAVRWSREQKVQLRAQLSSLQINVLPALAARLGMSQPKSDCGDINILKESLQQVLSMTYNESVYRSTVERHMSDYFAENASPAVKDACRFALLKEFNVQADMLKSKSDENDIGLTCSALLWLIGLIQRFDRKSFETVLKLFCEDTDLLNSINTRVGKSYQPSSDILVILINLFLKALGKGDIITPASFRLSFLTNWVDTMATLMTTLGRFSTSAQLLDALEKGIADVADTLPLAEQRVIYDIWKDAFTKNSLRVSGAFNWWTDKLHDAFTFDKAI